MFEMNCNACDGTTDLTDSSDKIYMGRTAPKLSHPTMTDPEVMAWKEQRPLMARSRACRP